MGLQHLRGRGERNFSRLFAADAVNSDRANEFAERCFGQAFGTITLLESPPFRHGPDQAAIRRVHAPQDTVANFVVERVAVRHDEIAAARRHRGHFECRVGGFYAAHIGWRVAKNISPAVKPANIALQCGQGAYHSAADMAGTEHRNIEVTADDRFQQPLVTTMHHAPRIQAIARTSDNFDPDLRIGRKAYTLLRRLGLGDVRVDYVTVDPVRAPREAFARVWIAWRDGYAEAIARETRFGLEEVHAHFDTMIEAIQREDGYGVWHLPVITGTVPG